MPNFSTEADVRLKFQLNDTVAVPQDLIIAAIDDAHRNILRQLDPEVDTESPEPGLVSGETLLAGAYLFRSLAAHDAFAQKNVTLGGQRIEDGNRFRALTGVAALTEKQAWYVLEPYLREAPARIPADATGSTPILGED
jgi:hypothetical protein